MKTLVALSLVVLALLWSVPSAQAIPVCTTTIVLPGGNGTILDSALGPGTCVQSQDKLYGTFNFGTLPQPGSVTFGFVTVGGIDRHNITFTDPFMPGNTYTDSFEVQVLQGGPFPINNFLTQLSADITQTVGGPTTLVETSNIAPNSGSINFSKTGNVPTGPFMDFFATSQSVTDLLLSVTLTTGPGSDVSAILNTMVESRQVSSVPEPTPLILLGAGLLVFGSRALLRKKS